jgi:hypothetical protein
MFTGLLTCQQIKLFKIGLRFEYKQHKRLYLERGKLKNIGFGK